MNDKLCKLLTVKHIFINAYPSEYEEVERKNKIISDFISKHCHFQQSNWDEFVRLAAFQYNCTRHAITKQIPFCLERGVHPRLEIDQIFKTAVNNNDSMNISMWTKELVPKIVKSLNEAAKKILDNQKKNSQKSRFIRRLLTVGDLVRIKRMG